LGKPPLTAVLIPGTAGAGCVDALFKGKISSFALSNSRVSEISMISMEESEEGSLALA
jgi:hypothetical protein